MTHQLATGRFSGAQGISSATSASTLSDSTQAWTTNQFAGFTVQSNSSGQHTVAKVASNTGTQLTISGSWDDGTPDSGQPYVVSNLQPAIGSQYHVGFTDGTHFYGYMLEPTPGKDGGYHDRSDITAKQSLIQYSSPNIIDRDFVYWPRVSQGDFSGGMGQTVAIDLTRFWDTTLDTSTPGYLQSWPNWASATIQATLSGASIGNTQIVSMADFIAISYGETNFRTYTGPAVLGPFVGDMTVITMDTDTVNLFISNGTKIEQLAGGPGGGTTTVTTAGTVAIKNIWSIEQGTNGRWIFYSDQVVPSSIYRVDLNGALPSAGVQVPLGSLQAVLVDMVAYQNGVALLFTEVLSLGSGVGYLTQAHARNWEVWFFDGANTTLLFHREGFLATGICVCQGNLYVTENPAGITAGPSQLVQITAGSVTTVVSLGLPSNFIAGNSSKLGPPRVNGDKVYFPVTAAVVSNLDTAYIAVFDATTGSFTHTIGSSAVSAGFRQMALQGTAVLIPTISGSVGAVTYQQAGTYGALFATGGKLITSRYDFSTPGVEKRFRRLEAIHAPIPTNCSLKIDAFVDKDPVAYTSGLTPDATITNSRVGSITTDFFLSNLIGHSAYFVFTFSSSDNAHTVILNWFSVEITTPRAWEFTLSCTNVIRLLNGQDDSQGLKAKDLADFWVDAWELPKRLTMFSRDGLAYAVSLETFDRWNPSPQIQGETARNPSEEYLVHVVLRQTLVAN